MHDFSCKNADAIQYDTLKKSVKHFKEEGGRNLMCKAIEDCGKTQALMKEIENIKSIMANLKLTADQAMQALNVPPKSRI